MGMLLAGCSKWEESPVVSQLKVINAYPEASSLSITVNGNPVTNIDVPPVPALTFGEASDYVQQRAGRSSLQVKNGESTLISSDLFLAENRRYSLYILKGRILDRITRNRNDTAFARIDSLPLPEIGRSKIRFVNLSPNAGTLQLVVTGPTVPAPVLAARTFTSFTLFTTVDAGQGYRLELQSNGAPVASLSAVQLFSERTYTFMAIGYSGLPEANPGRLRLEIIRNE
jgi:hypothetical protein